VLVFAISAFVHGQGQSPEKDHKFTDAGWYIVEIRSVHISKDRYDNFTNPYVEIARQGVVLHETDYQVNAHDVTYAPESNRFYVDWHVDDSFAIKLMDHYRSYMLGWCHDTEITSFMLKRPYFPLSTKSYAIDDGKTEFDLQGAPLSVTSQRDRAHAVDFNARPLEAEVGVIPREFDLTQLLRKKAHLWQLHEFLSQKYLESNATDKAGEEAEKAVSRAKEENASAVVMAQLNTELARILKGQGHLAEALRANEQALKESPQAENYRLQRDVLQQTGKYADAIGPAEKVTYNVDDLVKLSDLYAMNGDKAKALQCLKKSLGKVESSEQKEAIQKRIAEITSEKAAK
jgi:tetratricopeptide (TPR) repeat protein